MKSWVVRMCKSMSNVSAEAKVLLAALVRQHAEGPTHSSVVSVGKRLGMSERVVSRALSELTAAEYLVSAPMPSRGRAGRPKVMYRVRPELIRVDQVREPAAPYDNDEGGHFEAVIDGLLAESAEGEREKPEPGKAPNRSGAADRLSPSNRLFLMVLLGLADKNGVVKGRGAAELSKLVGLTSGRFGGQTQKLLALGYLRTVVPGVSARSLFGKRPGAYFLNLTHPSYKGLVPEITFLIPVEWLDLSDRRQGIGRLVYRQLQLVMRQQRQPSEYIRTMFRHAGLEDSFREIKRLAALFDGVGSTTLLDYFQIRLEAYAAYWLTYGQLPDHDAVESQLKEIIAQEAFRVSFKDLKGVQRRYLKLVEYLARWQADVFRQELARIDRLAIIGLEGASYTVIPSISTSKGHYLALCAVPGSGWKGGATYFVAREGSENGIHIGRNNIPDKEMFDYGLLTRHMTKPVKTDILVIREHFQAIGHKNLFGEIE